MTVFAEKNPLELEILAIAVSDRAHARTVLDILDRASWYNRVAHTAIEQVAKHGKILDQHVRAHPDVEEALLLRLNHVTHGDMEKLCWNHLCITNSDTQMALLRITARPGYEDLRVVLEAILMGNVEKDEANDTVSEDELSPNVSAMIDNVIDTRRVTAERSDAVPGVGDEPERVHEGEIA